MNRACFPKEKHQNSQKWAKFMNFSFWPFLWFGLPGRLLEFLVFERGLFSKVRLVVLVVSMVVVVSSVKKKEPAPFQNSPLPARRTAGDSKRILFLASPSVTFGVSFFAVFLGHSLCTKEEEFYCLQGRSEGLFRKMTLVFPCFAVYATYEQVSLSHAYMGRFLGNSLVLAKYPNEK